MKGALIAACILVAVLGASVVWLGIRVSELKPGAARMRIVCNAERSALKTLAGQLRESEGTAENATKMVELRSWWCADVVGPEWSACSDHACRARVLADIATTF